MNALDLTYLLRRVYLKGQHSAHDLRAGGIWLQSKSSTVFLLVRCSMWCCMHSRIVGYSPKCLVSVNAVGSECGFIGVFFVRYELSDM